MTNWIAPDEFEARVAHVARALWPNSGVAGSLMLEGRERDGVYITEECVHLIEATARRDLQKAREDCDKLKDLAKRLKPSYPDKAVKLWFITKDQPTADQRTECLKSGVTPASFPEFQSRLIDVRTLIDCRANYRFGSNDETGPAGHGERSFVDFGVSTLDREKSYSIAELTEQLRGGKRFTLLGDFGAGKSTTLLRIYRSLAQLFLRGNDYRFPIFINLRDHHGQTDSIELLERHARRIGFSDASHLVRAWRAGYCYLLIDGFDEVSPLGASAKSSLLKNARREALNAVRELVKEQPKLCGLMLSGRPQYFDSVEERKSALGTTGFVELILNDFTDVQVESYLRECGLDGVVPKWLPKRPYLVATLARRGVTFQQGIELEVGAGWNYLLHEICEREAGVTDRIDGPAVRLMLERLATLARRSMEGMGPLAGTEFLQVFKDVCGFEPDDRGHQLLARLSGLAMLRPGEDSRNFVDEDFADACRAGDLARACESPWDENVSRFDGSIRAMGATGLAVAETLLSEQHPEGLFAQAFERLTSAAKLDVFQIMASRGIPLKSGGRVKDVAVAEIDIVGGLAHSARLVMADSYIDRVILEGEKQANVGIAFESTNIRELVGPAGLMDVPEGFLDDDSDVESWASEFARNAEVMNEIQDVRIGVLITILRKLFLQTGNGRKVDALFRGLSPDAQRYVVPISEILEKNGIASAIKRRGTSLLIPNRSSQARVDRIVRAPSVTPDPVLAAVRAL